MTANDSIVPTHDASADTSVVSATRVSGQLSALAAELSARRRAILDAWRTAGDSGAPERSIAASLSRAQFNDHIPAVLDCFAHTIREWPGTQDEHAGQAQIDRVCEHARFPTRR